MTMKSIRHTLLVYFLVLLTAALTAVSWWSYRTAAFALRGRQADARKLIETQLDDRSKAVKAELDRRLLQQAVTMQETRLSTPHYEVMQPVGLIGATALSFAAQGYLHGAVWGPTKERKMQAAEPSPPNPLPMPPKDGPSQAPPYVPMWYEMVKNPQQFFPKAYPRNTNIEVADALVANPDHDHPQEYFQTYKDNGQPMQRSVSLGDQWFTLDKGITLYEYDEVDLRPDLKVRRVTLKTSMSFQGAPWWPNPPRKGGPKGSPGPGSRPPPPGNFTRMVFIQYAADLGPIQEKIRGFQKERDEQIAAVANSIDLDLVQLRNRMFWIGCATLIAIWLGGYGLIRLGLAPLAKMSEAVRQVSPTNFHLPLDPEQLPQELQPIASRMEEALEELHKAFAREKQAAADISHELRTPLAALMTTLEVGLRKTRSPEEYREILDECRSSGQHMYQLVERLLTLARLDAGVDAYRAVEVDVTETALSCADLIRPLARARGLELRLHLPDPITMRTDGDKLHEVLVNLLHNAVEYNKPNGAIDLTVEHVNGQVRFEVRDTGIGIAPAARAHLFVRFCRADPSRHADTPHAGLGLAIVKSFVELMGGTIHVESSVAGTAFSVELPFVAAQPDLATAVMVRA